MQCIFFLLFFRKIAWRQLGRKAGKSLGSTIHLDGIENERVLCINLYKTIDHCSETYFYDAEVIRYKPSALSTL